RDVLDLWRELTSEKSIRHADYIGEPARFAAYLRYFLPWNVVRLIPILAQLEIHLSDGSKLLDIGSGPLTLPIALWIARPELRDTPLHVLCVDRVRRIVDTGADILNALALRSGKKLAWKLETARAAFPGLTPELDTKGPFDLVSAANVFNESFWKSKDTLTSRAETLAGQLSGLMSPAARVLVVEPGDPRSGAMLAALREAFILRGGAALAPCPHQSACPMPGAFLSAAFRRDAHESDDRPLSRAEALKAARRAAARFKPPITPVITAKGRSKAPWCHFVIDHSAAPERLVTFSESTGLPKDRLVASWLFLRAPGASSTPEASDDLCTRSVMLISDAFRLPEGRAGRYACTKTGYTLARGSLADLPSGSLAVLDKAVPPASSERDPKSSAVIVEAYSDAIPVAPLPQKHPAARQTPPQKRPQAPRRPDPGPRGSDARRERTGLAERSPYARAKKRRDPPRPKRSS
ncbi:MAG: hypothetical protein JXM71_01545, partial [Spirochaetales bacterium]|nr:hypothetical protein [Spirochaetales bacterium]